MPTTTSTTDPIEFDPALALLRTHLIPLPPLTDSTTALTTFLDTLLAPTPSMPTPDPIVILIGDASHGTSEYYAVRAELTKHLITHHGFTVVAAEADWPDAEAVDRYVGGREPAFARFPTWMWRNREVQGFVEWLRGWNRGVRDGDEGGGGEKEVGFYGLDLYSLRASMEAVVEYLERVDPEMAKVAAKRYSRMMAWAEDPHGYGMKVLGEGLKGCEKDVVRVLKDLLEKKLEYAALDVDGEEFHSAEQNARLVRDAEQYYKSMHYGRDVSWNTRDRHMFDTLARVLKHRGKKGPAKAVVWAHNSHIGDASATSMSWSREEFNIGQLCKETFGEQALSIGCCGNTGTVAAARRWGADMEVMQVRPGLSNSYEELMHATEVKSFALDLREGHCDGKLRKALSKKRLERFIGVVYVPHTELQSHYSSAVLPEQFDGFIWFDETRHVGALEVHQPHVALEYGETWPFGL
ncbi:erythromycin esterase-domain-containing protein [Chaetomium tenue]|uniref:Erythromycin esterase-domain-containing protein n=1 Tax=Chaetomium tenue TaxID=1854479 RepID=A0ACB7PHB5_9PEZI|nr:erythromycin esterase-domain-containing protein [Chaetomium globosum]